ncbi:hypothetical protein EDB89DRAFT_1903238 [Lactarius sanguifluus]|nr:hypothetical protein EDB89DRAFT_1903238 [Lactarius sanguifluus]
MAKWEHTGHGAKACDAMTTDFMIDIMGKPKSPWNVTAGHVFTEHLIEKMGYDDTQETRKAIEKAFSNWVKSLQSHHKREELPLVERAIEKSRHSRQQCKYQGTQMGNIQSRLQVFYILHTGIFYTIFWVPLHHRHHIMSWGVNKCGALPHICVAPQKIHNKLHAPPGLLINAYNPIWLDSREVLYLKHVLCPKEEPYTFGHPSNVIVTFSPGANSGKDYIHYN